MTSIHPHWSSLLRWLASHGMATDDLKVEARSSPGAGYGLFATGTLQPSEQLFSIPAMVLMNCLTLEPHYPATRPKLSGTQIVSMHLLLHRPADADSTSEDSLFGPFISVLPREMDFHPLTWLWKENVHPGSIETQLLDALPRSVMEHLNQMFGLFKSDWKRIQQYLRENPMMVNKRTTSVIGWEGDYLWAWLIVNTRCIYHRLVNARSSPDNLTLCPILDFANHTYTQKFAYPGAYQAEIFNVGPSSKRKFGEDFVLLAPSTEAVVAGEQLFLQYGMHANRTLFTEYGFVNFFDWDNVPESFQAEVEVDSYIEALFERRGELGSFMKNVLVDEGYWRDWTMQTLASEGWPSYRVVTALRLVHILPPQMNCTPSNLLLDEWRNTTFGKQEIISEDNERLWRDCLMGICEEIVVGADEGRSKIKRVKNDSSEDWIECAKCFIDKLWEEEKYVSRAVIANRDFKV